MELKQHGFIQIGRQCLQRNMLDDFRSPERRLRYLVLGTQLLAPCLNFLPIDRTQYGRIGRLPQCPTRTPGIAALGLRFDQIIVKCPFDDMTHQR